MAASLADYSSDRFPVVRLRRVRRLPLPGDVIVDAGTRVEPDTIVARIALRPGIPWVVPVARMMTISPADLPAAMVVAVGDSVKTKQIIARVASAGGTKEYGAPTDGVVEDISPRSGRVVIREVFGREEPPVNVDVAFDLGMRPREVLKSMLVHVGQEVKKSQIIAKKGEMAAYFTKVSTAPISGVVSSIDANSGVVTIARPFKEVVVKAYIHGHVAEVMPERGVVVESPAVRIPGIFGVGRETHGELVVVTESPSQVLTADLITAELAGKVVVGGSLATNDALTKALEVGVRGLVTGTAHYLHLIRALSVKLGVGITGQEDIPMTVVLIEGFGHLDMNGEVWDTLKRFSGHEVSVNGATQIRAGAIRPEVVVAFPEYDGPVSEERAVDEELAVGQRVRIINEPYFGALGEVVEVPVAPQVVETEAKVPVAMVKLADGRTVTVPRPNVEVF